MLSSRKLPTIWECLNTLLASQIGMDEILRELGLDDKEIRIYKNLVAKKQLTAYEVAKNTSINRSTVYDSLDRLVRKGFVSSIVINGKKFYQVKDIGKIISSLKEKETLVQALLPEILKAQTGSDVGVELIEGIQGQRDFFFSLFNLAKNRQVKSLHMIGSGEPSTIGSRLYIRKLIGEWKKINTAKDVEFKCIWDDHYRGKSLVKELNFGWKSEDRFLPSLPSKVTISIYGDYIAFSFTIDKPYVIRIKNALVARTLDSYFGLLWGIAKP